MMQPEDVLLILVVFVGLLTLGAALLDLYLDTDAHKDSRKRHAHPLADERWWKPR